MSSTRGLSNKELGEKHLGRKGEQEVKVCCTPNINSFPCPPPLHPSGATTSREVDASASSFFHQQDLVEQLSNRDLLTLEWTCLHLLVQHVGMEGPIEGTAGQRGFSWLQGPIVENLWSVVFIRDP